MRKDIFDDFDTRYWQPKDKAWMAEREQQWREVEKLLYGLNKSKKAVGICKRYFFKGTLPDWYKLRTWEHYARHLDLMLFLYLHPCRDEAVLRPLCEGYQRSRRVLRSDIAQGFVSLWRVGFSSNATSGGAALCSVEELEKSIPHLIEELELVRLGAEPTCEYRRLLIIHTQGNNELLFRLMCPDPAQNPATNVHRYTLRDMGGWGRWLTLPRPLHAGAEDMLFQYDLPLETWYAQCGKNAASYQDAVSEGYEEWLLVGLYRIYHFDQSTEGDSRRTRFVRKVIRMLDEREFPAALKALWDEVKRDEVEVGDAWGLSPKVLASKVLGIQREEV
ncbi:hypothetical protein D3C78_693280 [compost metagenome]